MSPPGCKTDWDMNRLRKTMLPCIYAVALTVLMTALSCGRVQEAEDAYISFSAGLARTKAPVGSASDISGFAVKAYHETTEILPPSPSESWTSVIRNADGRWEYQPLQPWQEGMYYFGAVYPEPSDDRHFSADLIIPKDGGTAGFGMQIEYYYSPQADEDLMTAVYTRSYSQAEGNSSPVVLNFGHLLSRVTLVGRAAVEGISVESVTFSGMHVCGSYNSDESQQPVWTPVARDHNGAVIARGSFAGQSLSDMTVEQDYTLLEDLMLIPQDPSQSVISITYSVGSGASVTKSQPLPSAPFWESGKSYRYKFTIIDDERIIFDIPEVDPWDNASGGIIIVE